MEIQFVKVTTASQVDIVAGLAKSIWPEHYIPIIGKEQVDFMLGKFQTSKAILAQIDQEGNHYFLIYVDFVPVGYFGIIEKYNEIFLSKLYLIKTERGKGFAHKAIDFLIARSREIGAAYINLTVNKENLNTINAYEKIGFENYGELVSDIGSGFVMDDYMMRLRITPR